VAFEDRESFPSVVVVVVLVVLSDVLTSVSLLVSLESKEEDIRKWKQK